MIIAIDTGGTKTLIATFDRNNGLEIKDQIKFPTPADSNEYLKTLTNNLLEHYSGRINDIEAIVIATPGVIDNGTITWGGGNRPEWHDIHVVDYLKKNFADKPIYMENDAKLGGLGEARSLKLDVPQVLYVAIGTGIGCGIVVDGHLEEAFADSEAGQMPVPFNNETPRWETIASGKAFYNLFGKFASEITDPKDWEIVADRISRGLLELIPSLAPDMIVIGGSIGTYFDSYKDALFKILEEKLPEGIKRPKYIKAKDSEFAVIYGCYYHALDQLAS